MSLIRRLGAAAVSTPIAIASLATLAPPSQASIGLDSPNARVVLTAQDPAADTDGSQSTGFPLYAADIVGASKIYSNSSIDAAFPRLNSTIAANRLDTVYAFIRCPTVAQAVSLSPECRLLGSDPTGAVIQGNQYPPLSAGPVGGWKQGVPGGKVLGVSTLVGANTDDIGTFIAAQYTAREVRPNGSNESSYSTGSEPRGILVVPRIPRAERRPLMGILRVGQPSFVQTPNWADPVGGPALDAEHSITAYVCANAGSGQHVGAITANDGCAKVSTTSRARNEQRVEFTPLANMADKYLVMEDSVTLTTRTGGARLWTWAVRSAAVRVEGVNGPLPNDGGAAVFNENAAGAGAAAGAGGGADAGAGAAAGGAGAAGDGGAAAGGSVVDAGAGAAPAAGDATGSNASAEDAAARAAGIDLAAAPLASADGRGSGAASKLSMQLASSKKVNRGRYISMKAVVSPKSSVGKIRISLVRFNAKGKAISSKAITAKLTNGVATKRWRIPKNYVPANFTLVASYVPSKKGAPGITRTAPVTIG